MFSTLWDKIERLLATLGVRFIPSHRVPVCASFYMTMPLPKGAFIKDGAMNLPMGDKSTIHVDVKDAQNDELGVITPAPTWESSDPTILTVTAASDGMSADAAAVKPGNATVKCVVTKNSDGTPKVHAELEVVVVAGEPASATLTADPPVPVSAPPSA